MGGEEGREGRAREVQGERRVGGGRKGELGVGKGRESKGGEEDFPAFPQFQIFHYTTKHHLQSVQLILSRHAVDPECRRTSRLCGFQLLEVSAARLMKYTFTGRLINLHHICVILSQRGRSSSISN